MAHSSISSTELSSFIYFTATFKFCPTCSKDLLYNLWRIFWERRPPNSSSSLQFAFQSQIKLTCTRRQ